MKAFILALFLSLALLPIGQQPSAQEARFKVKVLHAGQKGNKVDPKIPKEIQKYLARSFGARYTNFSMLDSKVVSVKLNQKGSIVLPDRSTLKLEFVEKQGQFIKLTMGLKELDTTIRIRNGGMFFQAGHKFKDGILVLAISATTGPGAKESISNPRPNPRKESHGGERGSRPIDSKPQRPKIPGRSPK